MFLSKLGLPRSETHNWPNYDWESGWGMVSSRPKSEEVEPPKPKPIECNHLRLELSVRPCKHCVYCNCGVKDWKKMKPYPDVLVRSSDKEIIRLSGNLVRASWTLSNAVETFLGKDLDEKNHDNKLDKDDEVEPEETERYMKVGDKPRRKKVKEEKVILEHGWNEEFPWIKSFKVVRKGEPIELKDGGEAVDGDEDSLAVKVQKASRRGRRVKENQENRKYDVSIKELFEPEEEKVFVLFDVNSDEPTLGISKETWLRLDRFINLHIDDVERKIESRKRERDFHENHRVLNNSPAFATSILKSGRRIEQLNTFMFEGWEEDFFNMGTIPLLLLHQANQDILIWDLKFAIEKWFCLGRGFPKNMENGVLDLFNDPDRDLIEDRFNTYGLYGIPYPNRYKSSYGRKKTTLHDMRPFIDTINFEPRWWKIVKHS